MKGSRAVVVLSGGQDSTTCLGWALNNYEHVHAISFVYGQKHTVEIMCARKICELHSVPFTTVSVPALQQFDDSALIAGNSQAINEKHHSSDDIPASFVPNRNAIFLTLAHAYAQKVNASDIITGVCQTDYSGYPDCRASFIGMLNRALDSGSTKNARIVTPLMYLDKAQIFKMAEDNDFLDEVINMSHTCYEGKHDEEHRHEWGYGCGECPACKLRAKGWEEFLAGKA